MLSTFNICHPLIKKFPVYIPYYNLTIKILKKNDFSKKLIEGI